MKQEEEAVSQMGSPQLAERNQRRSRTRAVCRLSRTRRLSAGLSMKFVCLSTNQPPEKIADSRHDSYIFQRNKYELARYVRQRMDVCTRIDTCLCMYM